MLVVDASVLATALGDDGWEGDIARNRLHGQQIAAPELMAEALESPFLTADVRMAKVPGLRCRVELLNPRTSIP